MPPDGHGYNSLSSSASPDEAKRTPNPESDMKIAVAKSRYPLWSVHLLVLVFRDQGTPPSDLNYELTLNLIQTHLQGQFGCSLVKLQD